MTTNGPIQVALPVRARAVSLAGPAAGRVVLRSVGAKAQQRYYQYVPRHAPVPGRTLVSVHGISRNARDHARLLAPLAEHYGATIVAPLFDDTFYSDYQRLGRSGRGRRADLALNEILNDVFGTSPPAAIGLFGYSGGGQFAHRYTLAYPDRVAALALAAPGWFTLPDPKRRYPYGLARAEGLPGLHFDPDRFLRVPTLVLVGAHDVERGASLRRSRRLDRDQGRDRVTRGKRWIGAMRREARHRGFATRYEFECMPNTDHDFVAAMTRDAMGVRVFSFLFGGQPVRKSTDSRA
jgi:pimeloyl-ACP methyl ester carboxylesterase